MKWLLNGITICIGLVIFLSVQAFQANNVPCGNNLACYLSNQQLLLPEGSVNDYPQYAALGGMPQRFSTGGERTFVFSPALKSWAAYDKDGYKVASGRANGGSGYCSDLGRPCRSPVGSHRVYRKGDSSCVSNKFPIGNPGAAMPYCMFFRGGYAIHGSPYISNANTSHGCIRVHTSAAKWLHRYFLHHGTKVVVLSY